MFEFEADLLYTSQEHDYKKQKIILDNVFEDLKIARIFEFCAPLNLDNLSSKDIKYAIETLKKPCAIAEDIKFRQEIFKIFLNNSNKNLAIDLYENLQDVKTLEKIKENYDFNYGGESDLPELKAVNYLFFIKNYFLFIDNLLNILKNADDLQNSGLNLLFEQIKREKERLNSTENINALEKFLNKFKNKTEITGELQALNGFFTHFNFDYDKKNIKFSYGNNTPFFELLKNLEDFLNLYKPEYEQSEKFMRKNKRNGEEIYLPEKYANFEKRFILKLIYAEDITEEVEISNTELINIIIKIHDSINISPFIKLAEQIKFYRTICKIIESIAENTQVSLCFPEIISPNSNFNGNLVEFNEVCDPVVAVQKIAEFQEKNKTANLPENKLNGIIPNDLDFSNKKLYCVTGPNNGGKTAFVRAVSIALIFAEVGAPIFCKSAKITAGLDVYTHFTADETHTRESGRLQDEINRLNNILKSINENNGTNSNEESSSLIILNETFAGTNSSKALNLFENFLDNQAELNFLCLYVTHFHNIAFYLEENAEKSEKLRHCGNLVASIDVDSQDASNNIRTYKIVVANPSDVSYSRDIVLKHGLSWEQMSVGLNLN